jgi:hypothetical protein
VAALAATVAAGCGAASGGGGGVTLKGSPAAAKSADWEVSQPQYDAVGTVADGNELVNVVDTGVSAYDRANGKLLWSESAPKGTAFCGSGQHAVAGKLPVGYGTITDPAHHTVACTSIGVIDLRTGKALWSKTLFKNSVGNEGMTTEISGSTVVAVYSNLALGFSVASGHELWDNSLDGEAKDIAVADGKVYALLSALIPGPQEAPLTLEGINPGNGHVTSRLHLTSQMTQVNNDFQVGAIVATSPMTLDVSAEDTNSTTNFVVLNQAKTEVARVIPAGAQSQSAPASDHVLFAGLLAGTALSHPVSNTIVTGNKLIAVTYPASGQSLYGLAAYDLTTGARLWAASQPGVNMVAPVAVDGSAIVTVGSVISGGSDTNPALVRVNLASGAVLSSTPRPMKDPVGSDIGGYRFVWADGRVYAADWLGTSESSDTPTVFAMSPARPE